MTITTKTGDLGSTLIKDHRLLKSDPLIQALGDLDECSSLIIYMQAHLKFDRTTWELIVHELYQISSLITGYLKDLNLREPISRLEVAIQSKQFLTQKFIFPFDDERAAHLHYVRAVIRRAERSCVALNQTQTLQADILVYLNRLSDFVFSQEL